MTINRRLNILFMVVPVVLGLAACQHDPIDSMMGKKAETQARLSTAANEAVASGKTSEALQLYSKLYETKSGNPEVVLNYAQLLRKTGDSKRALEIMRPLLFTSTGKQKSNIDSTLLTEYAATKIALGDFEEAESLLNRVLEDSTAQALHPDAYNLMGVALDARGQRKEAEQMFRQAMEDWPAGDPTSVMNNLALNLAGQANFDESLDLLRKAQVLSPQRQDIARNIRAVEDLRRAVVPRAPVSISKPETGGK